MFRLLSPVYRFVLCLWLGAVAGCAQLQPRPELTQDNALPPGEDSPLDRATADAEAQHPRESAFRLVVEGTQAFAVRAQTARMAQRSLDVQTYIWHADLTGLFFAHEALRAADRGVRVRLLIDDIDARAKNAGFAALAAHPNIDVRLFNPFASRSGAAAFLGEGLRSFGRVNRRMHNKSWIADNRLALVGGRNLGDEYFSASDAVNFVDLDFAMIGPVVRDASASFDQYWNSPSAYPIEVLDPRAVTESALEKLRSSLESHGKEAEQSRYAQTLRNDDALKRMMEGDWPVQWASNYRFVADDPLKIGMTEQSEKASRVGAALLRLAQSAQREMTIVSPYFVPGESGTRHLTQMAQNGRRVRVLTNSLAANDVAAVHGGYSRYRKPLLAGGVELWELKPLANQEAASSMFGSSGASLHTKALFVDGATVFVGSYNLDPRSTWLNCEQGVLVENPTLAREIEALFAQHTAEGRAWQVTLAEDGLAWSDGRETFDSDPDASAGRRFTAWLTRVLGLEAQL